MKAINILAIIVLSLVFTACEDDSVSNEDRTKSITLKYGSEIHELVGLAENWNDGLVINGTGSELTPIGISTVLSTLRIVLEGNKVGTYEITRDGESTFTIEVNGLENIAYSGEIEITSINDEIVEGNIKNIVIKPFGSEEVNMFEEGTIYINMSSGGAFDSFD